MSFRSQLSQTGMLLDEQGRVVCFRCVRAHGLWQRMRGLLGRSQLAPGEGLLIPRASSIHTFFMRFPVDAVFLDRTQRVRSMSHELAPFRIAGSLRGGSVVELASGEARRAGIEVGSLLSFSEGLGSGGELATHVAG